MRAACVALLGILALAAHAALAMLIAAQPASAATAARTVLVVYSNGRLLPANIAGDRGLRDGIASSSSQQVAVFDEFLDVPHFDGRAFVDTTITYLRGKYAAQRPDVIVAAGNEAVRFFAEHRARLFPGVPIVHIGVAESVLRALPPQHDPLIGAALGFAFEPTVRHALDLHPSARRLVLVTGTSQFDREWEAKIRDGQRIFGNRVTIEWLAGLPTAALLARLKNLEPGSVVYTPGFFRDGDGRSFTPRESVQAMAAVANAPIYGSYSTFIGTGAVGGVMTDFEEVGRQGGRIVTALLDGADPASIALPAVSPMQLNLDWRAARRWNIAESSIPGDAIVHFRELSLVEQHPWVTGIVGVLLVLQAALISILLLERRRRRLAESAVQTTRSELAHSSRVTMAGELASAIAHEINQPLGAILSNVDAADLMLAGATDQRDELRAIVADIRRDDLRASQVIRRLRDLVANHAVEKRPFDFGEAVRNVDALLHAEAQRRHVAVDVRTAPGAVWMLGDRIQIQQVLINLILNAMDAVAALSHERRTVHVSTERSADGITIAIRDSGPGVAPADMPKLFDSFFSTKRSGMGMGLSISRTIVEAHGGRIRAESVPGQGATFFVHFPESTLVNSPASLPA